MKQNRTERALALMAKGISQRQAARQVGMTVGALRAGRRRRQSPDFGARPWPSYPESMVPRSQRTFAIEMAMGGVKAPDIARVVDAPVNSVRRLLRREIGPRPGGRSPGDVSDVPITERSRAIVEALRAGRRPNEIAADFGVTRQAVSLLRHRWLP